MNFFAESRNIELNENRMLTECGKTISQEIFYTMRQKIKCVTEILRGIVSNDVKVNVCSGVASPNP